MLRRFSDRQGVGLTAAAVTSTGTWSGAAGTDGNGRALVPSTEMAIGDITVTFVTAEILHLAARGRVDLDAPLSSYLSLPAVRDGATVRQALQMQSGFPEYDTESLVSQVLAQPDRHWTPEQALAGATGTPSPPGKGYTYCYTNFMVLGLLIEKVTGRPLARVLRDDLLVPAGVPRVTTQDGEQPPQPIAAPGSALLPSPAPGSAYLPNRAATSASWAASGMAGDAPGVARWGYLLYGSRVVPTTQVTSMTAFSANQDGQWGLGTAGFAVTGHPGVGMYGSILGYTSVLAVFPEQHLSLAILVPRFDVGLDNVLGELFLAATS